MANAPENHAGRLPAREKRVLHQRRLERLPRVIAAYLRGATIKEIAQTESVTRKSIDKDLEFARKIWRERNVSAATQYFDEQLERINQVELEAWRGWERSVEQAVQRSLEVKSGGVTSDGAPAPDERKKKTVRANQAGDPRFLEIIRKCIDDRLKMLKLGQYSSDETVTNMPRTVEVVVENAEQVKRLMNYQEYEDLINPSTN